MTDHLREAAMHAAKCLTYVYDETWRDEARRELAACTIHLLAWADEQGIAVPPMAVENPYYPAIKWGSEFLPVNESEHHALSIVGGIGGLVEVQSRYSWRVGDGGVIEAQKAQEWCREVSPTTHFAQLIADCHACAYGLGDHHQISKVGPGLSVDFDRVTVPGDLRVMVERAVEALT